MKQRTFPLKQTATILFALAGIGVMVFYATCDTDCSYLQGDIFGADLKYIGVLYMAVIALLAWMKSDSLLRVMLAGGLGGEVFLVWFQMNEGVYCPYCLAFMACLIAAFAANYEPPGVTGWRRLFYLLGEVRFPPGVKRYPLALFALAGFCLMVLTFTGRTLPVYAAETGPRSYGTGGTEIRVYTDYFCGPCSKAEPRVEKLIEEIVRKGKGRIVFIDTPIHQETILYAKYFIFAMAAANNDIATANRIRRTLFEAAGAGIRTPAGLEEFLKARGVRTALQNTAPFFRQYTEYITTDKVKSTPTIVVVTPAGKASYGGGDDIVKTLEKISTGSFRISQ